MARKEGTSQSIPAAANPDHTASVSRSSQRMQNQEDEDLALSDPNGDTIRTYLELLKIGASGAKTIALVLGLSESEVSYHLGKLVGAGYVERVQGGRYLASEDVARIALTGYSRIGSKIVPQLGFAAVLFSILIGFFSLESWMNASYLPFLITSSAGSVAAIWYLAIR